MMLEASRPGGTVELMRGPCGAPCAREGEHERGVACGQVFDEKFRREVSEAMRGGDVGSQAEVTETEMEAMPRHDPWELLKASRIAVLCLGSSRKAPGPFKIVIFTVTVRSAPLVK